MIEYEVSDRQDTFEHVGDRLDTLCHAIGDSTQA